MRVQRDNRVLVKNFDHRYRWPNACSADPAALNDVSWEGAAYSTARAVISSLVCSLVFLMLVAVAVWILVSPGVGHAAWQ